MRISRKRKEEDLRRLLTAATTVFLLTAGGLAADTWHTLQNTPVATNSGAAIVLGRPDSLYAMFGGGSTAFRCYMPSTGSWSSFIPAQLPFASQGGSALVADTFASCIYALAGGGTPTVWQYNIPLNTWSQFQSLPVPVYAGGSLALEYRNGTLFIYAIVGGQSSLVYRYGPYGPGGGGSGTQPQGTTENWYQVASLPNGLQEWPGACLAATNDSVFCIPCYPNDCFKVVAYAPTTNFWYPSLLLTDEPCAGCAMAGWYWVANGDRDLRCLVGDGTPHGEAADLVCERHWNGETKWSSYSATVTHQNLGASIAWGTDNWSYAFFGGGSNAFKRSYYY